MDLNIFQTATDKIRGMFGRANSAKARVADVAKNEYANVQAVKEKVEEKKKFLTERVDSVYTQTTNKGNQKDVLAKVSEDLIDIESNIPSGGSVIKSYEKGKHEHIGIVTNFSECTRTIPKGEFRPSSVRIDGKGSYTVQTAVPYTEAVENSRFPCGDYTISVGNQYNLDVGAGGININTFGNRTDGVKGRYIVSTKEFNLGASDNINIRGGSNISLISRGSFNLSAPSQVVVDTNLGVTKNAIINGCAFIDGEIYLNHITCPAEVQFTGGGIGSFAQLMPSGGSRGEMMIGYADVSTIMMALIASKVDTHGDAHNYSPELGSEPMYVPVFTLPSGNMALSSKLGHRNGSNPENSIFVYPHEHPFNNIPISFTKGNGSMRERANVLNSGNVGVAGKIQHGFKVPS